MEELTIEAGRAEAHYWRDLWRYRDLFYFLAWRDLLVRYKQTVFGVLWAILRPFLTMVIFVVIFSRVAGLPSADGVPYAILVLGGMLPWQFFAASLSESSSSLLSNAGLITKIYFPRIILPASSLIVATVDFGITLAMMAMMAMVMVWYRYLLPARIVFLPVFVLLALVSALGPGLIPRACSTAAKSFPAFSRECGTQLGDDLLRLVLLPSFGRHRKSPPPQGHRPSYRLDKDFQGRPASPPPSSPCQTSPVAPVEGSEVQIVQGR